MGKHFSYLAIHRYNIFDKRQRGLIDEIFGSENSKIKDNLRSCNKL